MTVKDLKNILDQYSDDSVLVRKHPYHWNSDSEELNESNFAPTEVKSITNNKGKQVNGKFLILYEVFDYDY